MSIAAWISSLFGGTSGLARDYIALFVGDSTTAGVGAGDGSGQNTSISNARPFSFPLRAGDRLAALDIPYTGTTINGENGNGFTSTTWTDYRPEITVTGALAASNLGPTAGGEFFSSINSTVREYTYAPPTPVNALDLWVAQSSTLTGRIQIDIDGGSGAGGSTQFVSNQNASDRILKVTLTGFPLGLHTFTFKRDNGTAGTAVMPIAHVARNSNVRSVIIMNAGMRNQTSTQWNDFTGFAKRGPSIAALTPDVTIFNLGINDYRVAGTSIATFTSNMQALINSALSVNSKIILVVPNPISGYNTTTDAWSQAAVLTTYQNLQAANPGSVLVNTPEVLFQAGLSGATNPATYAALNAAGNMADTLHPRAPVYTAMGNAIGDAIKQVLAL